MKPGIEPPGDPAQLTEAGCDDRWFRRVALCVWGGLLLAAGGFAFLIYSHEVLYPWADGSGNGVVVHVESTSECPVSISWQRSRDSEWQGTRVAASSSRVFTIEPIVEPQPLRVRVDVPAQCWCEALETSIEVASRSHVLLSIDAGKVTLSQGSESFVGYPIYEAPQALGMVAQ